MDGVGGCGAIIAFITKSRATPQQNVVGDVEPISISLCPRYFSKQQRRFSGKKLAFDEPILETRFAVGDALRIVQEHEMFSEPMLASRTPEARDPFG